MSPQRSRNRSKTRKPEATGVESPAGIGAEDLDFDESTEPFDAPEWLTTFVRDEVRPFLVQHKDEALCALEQWRIDLDEPRFLAAALGDKTSPQHVRRTLEFPLPPARDRNYSPDECLIAMLAAHDETRRPKDRLTSTERGWLYPELCRRVRKLKKPDLPDLQAMLKTAIASMSPDAAPTQKETTVPTNEASAAGPTAPPAESESDAQPESATSMNWQAAAERMERLRTQGEPFTSQGKLAEAFGCSSGTINKAIKKTPSLQAWAKPERATAPKSQSLSGMTRGEYVDLVTDHTPSNEPDPADDAAIREYLEREDLKPEERAFFNSLSRENQLDFLDDPDKHRKILGRKP